MDNVNKAIVAAMNEFEKEYGEGAKIENGDIFVTVFNDCVLIISEEEHRMIEFIPGKPYNVDMNVGFFDESED